MPAGTGYVIGLQYAAYFGRVISVGNIGSVKCVVCPTNRTVGRATTLPAHYVPVRAPVVQTERLQPTP